MIAYKVTDNSGYSCTLGGKYALRYKVGEVTRPLLKGSGIFVFKDVDVARRFGMSMPFGCVVWEVEVPSLKRIRLRTDQLYADGVERFWKAKRSWNPFMRLYGWLSSVRAPQYSYLAPEVKPIKRVG